MFRLIQSIGPVIFTFGLVLFVQVLSADIVKIKTGSGAWPKLVKTQYPIKIAKDQSAEVEIITGDKWRALKFDNASEVKVTILDASGGEVLLGSWYRCRFDCRYKLLPQGTLSANLELRFGESTPAEIAKWREDSEPPLDSQMSVGETATLQIEPKAVTTGPPSTDPKKDSGGPPAEQKIPLWLLGAIGLVVSVALIVVLIIVVLRWSSKRTADEERRRAEMRRLHELARDASAVPPTQGAEITPQLAVVEEDPMVALTRRVSGLEGRTLSRDEIAILLKGLSHQVQGVCQTAIDDSLKDARADHTKILERIEMLAGRVRSGESRLLAMETQVSAEFQALLLRLPRLALNAGSDGDFAEAEESMVAKRVEEAVSSYMQSAGPPEDSLRSLSQRAEALQKALEGFRDALPSPPPLIVPILRDIREAREEIEGLLADRTDRRLHLRFTIDFSTLRSSTRSLTEDIADGLKRQIVKLENLSEYFERRLTNSATLAASTAIDLADGQADPDRRNAKLQEAITALLAAGEIQEIAPLRNEPFSAVDHMMLQRTRRANALDKPQAVARLVTRGIVHRGQILRKATVVIFE